MDKTIVKKFKEGNKDAALAVLHKYEPLINKYCLKTNLKGFDKNDLRQEASLSVLKALNALDLNKDSITYDAYIMNTIRNTFNLLIRNHHKSNLESSLNINVVGDYDIIDLLEDSVNLEELLISSSIHTTLKEALSTLSSDELEVLYLIFYKFKGKLRPFFQAEDGIRDKPEERTGTESGDRDSGCGVGHSREISRLQGTLHRCRRQHVHAADHSGHPGQGHPLQESLLQIITCRRYGFR